MKSLSIKISALLLAIISIVLVSCSKTEENLPDKPVPITLSQDQAGVVEAGNAFAFDIFREFLNGAGESQNVIMSPLSISSALSMALNGANGDTRDAMLTALRLKGLTPETINDSYKNLTEAILSVDSRVLIKIANSVWTEEDFAVKQAFIDILTNYYSAEDVSFDIHDPATPGLVNKWIEDHTNGLIKNMIDRLDSNTVMLLINAIYFKGKWKSQFDASKTVDMPFYRSSAVVNVPTMKQESDFSVYKGNGFTIAEFPYGQGNFAMDVILPDSQQGLNDLLPSFTAADFYDWTSRLDSQKVNLSFPRFKFGYKQDLIDILTNMGMGIAFDPDNADFSNINDQYQLYINKALHQAFIETNEEGTEAAAATIIGIGVTSVPVIMELKLDHPFLFVIRETSTNAILFMGRVSDPSVN